MHSTTTDKGGWCVIWGGVLGQVGYRASPDRRAQVPALRPREWRGRAVGRHERGHARDDGWWELQDGWGGPMVEG